MSLPRLARELIELLWVAAGAVPGALLRWSWSGDWTGTLLANLAASFLLGSLLPLQRRHPRLLLVAGVGFCGSLSTFSTLMLELLDTLQSQQPSRGLIVLLANLIGGLVAVALGHGLIQGWIEHRQRHRASQSADHQRSSG